MSNQKGKYKHEEKNNNLEYEVYIEPEEVEVKSEREEVEVKSEREEVEVKLEPEESKTETEISDSEKTEKTLEEEHLEQELNEFIIETFKKVLPFLNSKVEKREQITLQDILDQLGIKTSKVNRCSYIFKRGIKAGKRCENICIDDEELCVKCLKRCDKNIRVIELIPDIEKKNEFSDGKGIRYRKLEDQTLEVINKEILSDKEIEKMKKLGIKFKNN